MKSWTTIICLLAALMLAACEQREQTGVATQPTAEREGQVAGQPATGEQQTTATGQQPTAERDIAGTPSTAMPPGDTMGRTETAPGQTGSQPAQDTPSDRQVAGSPSQGTQPSATGSRESSEFYGQSPQFGNAPETIILKASNGNVTLSHKKHAGMMDCKSCHGDGTPGPIEGFNKDQAHSLCTGCHKEKGAGPTKCQDCHKKQ